jgi:hypothetical protein
MKYAFYIYLLILCASFFSCKDPSPTQIINHKVDINPPPNNNAQYFTFSFSIGTVWRFSYDYSFVNGFYSNTTHQTGIHEWKIVSSSVANQDTIYAAQQIRRDTVHFYGMASTGIAVDTTYTINDTSQFSISLSISELKMQWPVVTSTAIITIPNHVYINADSVYAYDEYLGRSYYKSQIGPVSYSYSHSIHVFTITEYLYLNDFIKP